MSCYTQTCTTALLPWFVCALDLGALILKCVDAHVCFVQAVYGQDILFQAVYESICKDKGEDQAPQFASAEHQGAVFKGLSCSRIFEAKGKRVSTMRWMSWVHGMNEFLPSWHTMLMFLTYIGLEAGFLDPSATDLPVFGSASKAGLELGDGAAPQSSSDDAAVDRKLQALRTTCRNTMHLVAMILGDPGRNRLCRILVTCSKPFASAHAKEVRNLTAPGQVKAYYIAFSNGSYDYVLRKAFSTLRQPGALRSMGFKLEADFGLTGAATSSSTPAFQILLDSGNAAAKMTLEEENKYANDAWNLVLQMVKHRCVSMAHYTHSFPGLFSFLVSDSPSVVRRGLAMAQEAWQAIEKAEVAALTRPCLARVLKSVMFLDWLVPREIFISLAQFRFAAVPHPVSLALTCFFEGFGQSGIVENSVNKCRDIIRESKNTRERATKRYYQPVVTELLQQYGRPEVKGLDTDRQHGQSLPKAIFKSHDEEQFKPSIDTDELKKVTGRASTWTTTNAQGLHHVPSAWQLVLHLSSNGGWNCAAAAWRSIFMLEGFIVSCRNSLSYLLVLWADQFSFLAWPCDASGLPQSRTCTPCDAEGTHAQWHHVFDYDDWQVWPATVVAPLAACCAGSSGPSISVHLANEPTTPLKAAAKQGFKGIGQSWLEKVAALIGCSFDAGGNKKKTLLCKVEALIRHLHPEASGEEVHAYMQIRNPKGFNSWLHSEQNLEQVDGVLDATDKKAAKVECQEEQVRRTARVQAAEYKAAKGAASGSGKGSSCMDLKVQSQSGDTKRKSKVVTATAKGRASKAARGVCERAEQFLPTPTVGRCFFQPYVTLRRVQVYYPRDTYPKSFSRMWAQTPGGVTEVDVVKACLKWAWSCHTSSTGMGCPFNIDELVL